MASTPQTKWPNDVLVNDAKICGMLLERSDQKHPDSAAIVIGIGLNVNMDATTAAPHRPPRHFDAT